MASSSFIDYVKIYCRSGKGGAGSLHFHRAKYVPKGGPDGGDGGRGGHIILRGNRNLWTLLHLKYQKHIFATDGGKGGPSRSYGKDGEDKIIEVPCGTVVYNGDTGEYMCEVKEHNQEIILFRGGKGGLGNWHFRTATNQAPRYAQPGEPCTEANVILQLKVLADVGLVGFPNAGKSTIINGLVNKKVAGVGDKPGVTKSQQWIRINQDLELLDTPGILWPKFENQELASNLAITGAIKDEIVDLNKLVRYSLELYLKYYPEELVKRYAIKVEDEIEVIIEKIAKKNTLFNVDKTIDFDRVALLVLNDIRSSRLGKITLDRLQ